MENSKQKRIDAVLDDFEKSLADVIGKECMLAVVYNDGEHTVVHSNAVRYLHDLLDSAQRASASIDQPSKKSQHVH